MATDAPITGAPTRAPSNIIPFPDTPLARLRRELLFCRNHKMLDRWSDRVKRAKGITRDEYRDLACRMAVRHLQISRGMVA